MTRQEINREILQILVAAVEDRPTERFGQILRNTGVVSELRVNGERWAWNDDFYLESKDTFDRMIRYSEGIYE